MSFRYIVTAVALSGLVSTLASAAPPVPVYSAHITDKLPYSDSSFSLITSDSLGTVTSFYRTHLKDMTDEHKDSQGSIFYTKSGATVTVTPGDGTAPGTTIAYTWDAKKYGSVPVVRVKH